MNRTEMVDKAASLIPSYIEDSNDALKVASEILDVILPRVATAADLEALPKNTRLLAADGTTWRKTQVQSWTSDQHLTRTHARLFTMKKAAPLTVIWQP